ncbi:MAG: class I SAM-dependent methyltransferase [Pseudomonadota bacterium]
MSDATSANPQTLLADARRSWQEGRYRRALIAFAQAARYGDEASVVALLRAMLALGYWQQAAEVVALWSARRPDYATVAAYQVLLTLDAEGLSAARAQLSGLAENPGFSQAVHWAIGQLDQFERGVARAPLPGTERAGSWHPALDGISYLLDAGLSRWFSFPVRLLQWAAASAPADGIAAECGVFWGRSIRLLAAQRREVHGFDSFQGLPSDWKEGEAAGAYSTGGQLPLVPSNVLLHRGWFERTVPPFVAEQNRPLDLLHVDCDLYESTRTVLDGFQPLMRRGTLIVFDDYMGYAGWRDHEHRAWLEFCERAGTQFRYVAAALLGREVVVEITQPPQLAAH